MLRRMPFSWALLACFITFSISGVAEAEPKRLALVVGVNAYPSLKIFSKRTSQYKTVNLANPENDVISVEEALRSMGFIPKLLLGSRGEARRDTILTAWSDMLAEVGPGDTVLFYFAGHGVELKGRNFLIPQDATYDSEAGERLPELTRSSVDFQHLVDDLGVIQTKFSSAVGVFIIDACRENIFREDEKISPDLPDGLKAILPPREMFIMYSAGIQQGALDGAPGSGHSLYAQHLLDMLKSEKRDWPLSLIAQTLRIDVYKEALQRNHVQTPAYYDQLTATRNLTTGGAVEVVAQPNYKIPMTFRSLSGGEVMIDCTYCSEVVTIPEGQSVMGISESEALREGDDGPAVKIRVPKPFAIGKFEVTNREWDACVRATGTAKCKGPLRTAAKESRLDRMPVSGVSWEDAQDFVRWASEVSGKHYRLPTEAEWEYAARAAPAGTEPTPYFFGASVADLCTYANGADQHVGPVAYINAACDDHVGREAGLIGLYKPNAFGVFDVHGNVAEWVEDCWSPSHEGHPVGADGVADATQAREAPGGAGACTARVVKGGSWRSGPPALRSGARNAFPPGHSRATVGFRVVREID